MKQCIIYQNSEGGVSVIYPAPEYADQIEAVAAKDVPSDKPWRLIDSSQLPSREFRDRWLWTESGPLALSEETQPE